MPKAKAEAPDNPPTPSPAAAAPRARPRKLADDAVQTRAESADGGVTLNAEETSKRKRRPRKLKPNTNDDSGNPEPDHKATTPGTPGLDTEVEALKARVKNLEGQIKELYNRPGGKGSPRRRGRRRKGASGQETSTETETDAAPTEAETEVEDEGLKELSKLENELETAQAELMALTTYKGRRTRKKTPKVDDDVEEIPRTERPRVQTEKSAEKQLILSGNYRIPLPDNVSMNDVKAIQEGVKSAGTFAKGIMEARRKARQNNGLGDSAQTPEVTATSAANDVPESQRPNWGQWLGGYSMQLTRFMKNINHEAAIEREQQASQSSQRRVPTRSRSDGAVLTSASNVSDSPKPKLPRTSSKKKNVQNV